VPQIHLTSGGASFDLGSPSRLPSPPGTGVVVIVVFEGISVLAVRITESPEPSTFEVVLADRSTVTLQTTQAAWMPIEFQEWPTSVNSLRFFNGSSSLHGLRSELAICLPD